MRISSHGAGNGQRTISAVQVGVLGIAVIACTVFLLRGDTGPATSTSSGWSSSASPSSAT